MKSIEGEAQIVLARGKKKFIYDFSIVLHFEVTMQDISNQPDSSLTKEKGTAYLSEPFSLTLDLSIKINVPYLSTRYSGANASKVRKVKGTITLSEVSPGTDAESNIAFKKPVPATQNKLVLKASSALRDLVIEKMKSFEVEFKAM